MSAKPKTILITAFSSFIGRNILSTDALSIVRDTPNTKIVILTEDVKKDSFQKLFGAENVIIEVVPRIKQTALDRFATNIFSFLLDTYLWKVHRGELVDKKKYLSALFTWALSKLGHFKMVRQLARRLDYVVMAKNRYKKYFDAYKPDLVFATDIFRRDDVDLMREAKHRGVRTLGMVRSWDNITNKGLNRIIPDELVAHIDQVKKEAIELDDVPASKIRVVGIPHYDRYLKEKRMPREEFFRRYNLDPHKKTIIFAPPGRLFLQDEPMAEVIVEALKPILREYNAQIILRYNLFGSSNVGNLKSVPNQLAIDMPPPETTFDNSDLVGEDRRLADMLYHSDLIVSYVSTLGIDGALFGKPSVCIGFNTEPKKYYIDTMRWYYKLDHALPMFSTGGVRLAKSLDELLAHVSDYLKNPKLDMEGRKRLLQFYCSSSLDAKSGERLARVILSQLD